MSKHRHKDKFRVWLVTSNAVFNLGRYSSIAQASKAATVGLLTVPGARKARILDRNDNIRGEFTLRADGRTIEGATFSAVATA